MSKKISSLSDIEYLGDFIDSHGKTKFKKCISYELRHLHRLFHSGELNTFGQLAHEFELPQTDFYRYVQLRHFLTRHQEFAKVQIELFLQDIYSNHNIKRVITKVYVIFLPMDVNNTSYLKDKRKTEIGSTITPDIWEQACEKAHQVSCSNI